MLLSRLPEKANSYSYGPKVIDNLKKQFYSTYQLEMLSASSFMYNNIRQ